MFTAVVAHQNPAKAQGIYIETRQRFTDEAPSCCICPVDKRCTKVECRWVIYHYSYGMYQTSAAHLHAGYVMGIEKTLEANSDDRELKAALESMREFLVLEMGPELLASIFSASYGVKAKDLLKHVPQFEG
jgi:hypothetical protein